MTSYFLNLAPVLVYAGLALLVAGESAGAPLPGETSLVAAAILAAAHRLSLPLVIGVAAAAAIAGDNIGYVIGRRGVRSLLLRGKFQAERRRLALERAERFFARRGRTAVFFGRWLPWLRVTVAWLAGAGRMRWRTFVVWNALGGLAWADYDRRRRLPRRSRSPEGRGFRRTRLARPRRDRDGCGPRGQARP
jgi:membrane protein DedA with SNARE-associated domain